MEFYVKDEKLIKEEEWIKKISSMRTSFKDLEENKTSSKGKISSLIENAVLSRTKGLKTFGIMFSGGVDSTLLAFLCKQHNLKFTCYSIGLENSKDIKYAKEISKKYGFELKYNILSLEDFETCIKDVVKVLNSYEIVWVSVGAVVYAASKLAIKDKKNMLLVGLGTEEIFAGYQRHEIALKTRDYENVHDESWIGLKNMWQRDLLRDSKIADSLGVEFRAPYMDLELIEYVMKVHPKYKISSKEKKIILREIAEEFGLDKEFAWRKKIAAQYGSNFVNGIDKLARKNGFKTKKEYLKSLLVK
jgi:diphthine-ammonia ligase